MKNSLILYIILSIFSLWGLLIPHAVCGQDVSINVLSSPATLPLSATGSIQVDLCNTDPSAVAVPVNKLNPQISVGSNVTILEVTNMDGSPLANFSILSNTGQVITLSNVVPLPNPSCLSFKVIIRGSVVDTPGNIGGVTGTLVFQNAPTTGNKTFNDTSTSSVIVTQSKPDLVPIMYARPSSVHGIADVSVVVDVLALEPVSTSGSTTVRITRDPMIKLGFDPNASSIGGRPVQNNIWTFDNSDPNYYVLTTTQAVTAGGTLSLGLSGTLNPSETSGLLSISSNVSASEGERKLTNNVIVNKIEYFAH